MTPEQLNEIEQRANQATQGPWEVYDRGIGCEIHIKGAHDDGEEYSVPINNGHRETFSKADAEFISSARTDVPALVAEVRRLRSQTQQLLTDLKTATDSQYSRNLVIMRLHETLGEKDE